MASRLKWFWKDKIAPAAGTEMAGVSKTVSPAADDSYAIASFGPLGALSVEVCHGPIPVAAAVVHPVGNDGAVTPSKFSEKVTPHGVGIGVPVGKGVGDGDGDGGIVGDGVVGFSIKIQLLVPVIEGLLMSVAVIVCSVKKRSVNLALKVPIPFVNGLSGGSPDVSRELVVKWTVPL